MYRHHLNEQRESELPLLESEELDKEAENSPVKPSSTQGTKQSSLRLWSLLITIACTLLNFFFWAKTHGSAPPPRTSLPRPSTYMGLADMKRNLTEEALLQFATFPPILTQISASQPDRIWPDDIKQELRIIGTISPDARRFQVSPQISSVAQFRAIDYGFESCSLRFSLQPPQDERETPVVAEPTLINVWLLDAPSRIKVRQLSYATRPPHKRLLDTVRLAHGVDVTTQSIKCPWGSFPTFEFECAQDDCSVDFWQNPKVAEMGVTMVQRSSLV